MLNIQSLITTITTITFSLASSQRQRRAHYVADLAPIQLVIAPVLFDIFHDRLEVADAVRLELLEEQPEDVLLLLARQVVVADGKMDTRLHGDVEGGDAVGGEDHNAVIVLKHAEKDYVESANASPYFWIKPTRHEGISVWI